MASKPMIHPPQNPNIRPPKPLTKEEAAAKLQAGSKPTGQVLSKEEAAAKLQAAAPSKGQVDAEMVRKEFDGYIDADLKIDHQEYGKLYGSIAEKFGEQLAGREEVKGADGMAIRGLGWDLDTRLNKETDQQGNPIIEFEKPEDRKDLEFLLGKMSDLPPSQSEGRDYLNGNTLNHIVTSDLNAPVNFKDMTDAAKDLFESIPPGDMPEDATKTFMIIPDLNAYAAITNSRDGRFSAIQLLPFAGGDVVGRAYLEGAGRWNRPMTPM